MSRRYPELLLEKLIAQQGTGPVNLNKVRAEFADLWPDDESIEAFQVFLDENRASST